MRSCLNDCGKIVIALGVLAFAGAANAAPAFSTATGDIRAYSMAWPAGGSQVVNNPAAVLFGPAYDSQSTHSHAQSSGQLIVTSDETASITTSATDIELSSIGLVTPIGNGSQGTSVDLDLSFSVTEPTYVRYKQTFGSSILVNSGPIKDSGGNVVTGTSVGPGLDLVYLFAPGTYTLGHTNAQVLTPPSDATTGAFNLSLNVVPEPTSLTLAGTILAFALCRRRRS